MLRVCQRPLHRRRSRSLNLQALDDGRPAQGEQIRHLLQLGTLLGSRPPGWGWQGKGGRVVTGGVDGGGGGAAASVLCGQGHTKHTHYTRAQTQFAACQSTPPTHPQCTTPAASHLAP